jgi:hypothetical protein
VANLHVTCGRQQGPGSGSVGNPTTYITAEGTLNGNAFLIYVFDPAGPGSSEGHDHIYVKVTPPGGDYYTWHTGAIAGVSGYSSSGGVELTATVPPRGQGEDQVGGQIPDGPITLTGRIVC